jgi:hypothetical protein
MQVDTTLIEEERYTHSQVNGWIDYTVGYPTEERKSTAGKMERPTPMKTGQTWNASC